MTNADARAVGDHSATTLSCQRGSKNDGSFSSEASFDATASMAAARSTSALPAVSSRVVLRPPATSTI